MLTTNEIMDVVIAWRNATEDDKRQTWRQIVSLRTALYDLVTANLGSSATSVEVRLLPGMEVVPPEQCAELALLIAKDFGVEDAVPAIELEILERMQGPRVLAWNTAARFISSALEHPAVRGDSDLMRYLTLFHRLVIGGIAYPDADAIESKLLTPKAEQLAVRQAGRRNGLIPHVNHARANEKLPGLWEKMKDEGKNKTEAAPLIAAQIGLSVKTVRRKLQGMK